MTSTQQAQAVAVVHHVPHVDHQQIGRMAWATKRRIPRELATLLHSPQLLTA